MIHLFIFYFRFLHSIAVLRLHLISISFNNNLEKQFSEFLGSGTQYWEESFQEIPYFPVSGYVHFSHFPKENMLGTKGYDMLVVLT